MKSNSGKLIIFDWDDTLFFTNFLKNNTSDGNKFEECKKKINEMVQSIIKLLNLAKECGKVCIVTNSEDGWIFVCCQKYAPDLYELIKNMYIISARSTYEKEHPKDFCLWKILAIKKCIADNFVSPDAVTDFIHFGDSHVDRYATKKISEELKSATSKSIKFCDYPTIDQLYVQQKLIYENFAYICTYNGNLDLALIIQSNLD
jgi:hypothetical protein